MLLLGCYRIRPVSVVLRDHGEWLQRLYGDFRLSDMRCKEYSDLFAPEGTESAAFLQELAGKTVRFEAASFTPHARRHGVGLSYD